MTGLPWYPKYPGDYARDTADLSMIEDGAYHRLLDQYYLTGAPLPKNKEVIYRVARALAPCERKAVSVILERYFVLLEDGYHNKRADLELTAQQRLAGKSRHEAKTAGQNGQNHLSTGTPPPQSQSQTTKEGKSPNARAAPARLPDNRREAMKNRMNKEAEAKREAHIGAGPIPDLARKRSMPQEMSPQQVSERMAVLRKQAEEITSGAPDYGCRSLRLDRENIERREKEGAGR